MIVKIGDKLVVKSKDGSQQFGEYDTEEAAKNASAEVEAFRHMNNKLQVNVLTTSTQPAISASKSLMATRTT